MLTRYRAWRANRIVRSTQKDIEARIMKILDRLVFLADNLAIEYTLRNHFGTMKARYQEGLRVYSYAFSSLAEFLPLCRPEFVAGVVVPQVEHIRLKLRYILD